MAEEKKKDRGKWFREMKSELKKVVWQGYGEEHRHGASVLPVRGRLHLDL